MCGEETVMAIRRRALPRGWYPDEPEGLRSLVESWVKGSASLSRGALAAVAPHAGWTFSGRIAARAIASTIPIASSEPSTGGPQSRSSPLTVVVFGGHLPSGARPLAAPESSFETPLGALDADLELLDALKKPGILGRGLGADLELDNTVEVLLPLVAAIRPGARILWLRSPNDPSSLELGAALRGAALTVGREIACIGSTDLTHYGPNYGFSPRGGGRAAEAWVREVNDRRFIEALLAIDGREAIARGEAERSACSAGAAAAALAYAQAAGGVRAELLEYATSLDVRRDESFVGYAALSFFPRASDG
jgi:MEMO1 family protein